MSNVISLAEHRARRKPAPRIERKPLNPLFLIVAVIAWALLA